MFTKLFWGFMLTLGMVACGYPEQKLEMKPAVVQQTRNEVVADDFKIPLPQGYNWAITQSWAEHCEQCDLDYPNDPTSYCNDSHASSNAAIGGCFDDCRYGWDLSLPGDADLGVSALASAAGMVKYVGGKNADGSYRAGDWGNTIVIDHGNNICTRYAHLMDGSIRVQEQQEVCQGLKIAEIGGTPHFQTHLHFQFEECTTQSPLRMGFTDGNDVPICKKGNNIYTNGVYTALQLNNIEKESCDGGAQNNGWFDGGCGSLQDCPRLPACTNEGAPPFPDLASLDSDTTAAVSYLWQECVLDASNGRQFNGAQNITRAEGLKIVMHLFGHMTGCQATEPFRDVRPSHWFYNIVRCGLTYGVINSDSTRFRPNSSLSFAEGAKILVVAAVRRGLIELQNPVEGRFSRISSNHWAYQYVETLRHYGAVEADFLTASPNRRLERGEFAKMAAGLSPCFCKSVSCDEGCQCNQASFACVPTVENEAVEDSEVAVSAREEPADEPEAQEARANNNPCVPNCNGRQCGADGCGGSCGNCAGGANCNNGQCQAPPPPPPPACQPNCNGRDCDSNGCGGVCGNCAAGINCLNGQCQAPPPPACQRNCNCGADSCGGNCGNCAGGQICVDARCRPVPNQWVCDPAVGYAISLSAPGGSLELLTSGPRAHYNSYDGQFYGVVFYCDELPAAILLRSSATPAQVWLQDNTLPAFAVYAPYNDVVTIDPGIQATSTTSQFASDQANSSMLIRISEGQAPVCQRNCNGRQCGADGCGGSCGNCAAGANCVNGQCQAPPPPACQRNCNGRQCGADGCGGSCGNCAGGANCVNGLCQAPPQPPPPPPPPPEDCGNGLDDDGDGQIDCADGNCAQAVAYQFHVQSPAAEVSFMTDGVPISIDFPPQIQPHFLYTVLCAELPFTARVRVQDGGPGVVVWVDQPYQAFGIYVPWDVDPIAWNELDSSELLPHVTMRRYEVISTDDLLIAYPPPVCQRNCNGRQCGADGCGGSCGNCAGGANCANGQCQAPACQRDCNGRQCGADGCGGSCGNCAGGANCVNGQCQAPACQRNCNGRQCGADGCGGSCGNCAGGANCVNGQCQAPPPPSPPAWVCNPAVGYTVTMSAPGGSWEAQTSGPNAAYYRDQMPGPGRQLPVQFNCDELPAAIVLRNAAAPAQVWLQDNSLPPFAVYVPYDGAAIINPGGQPTSVTRQFPPGQSNTSMLIRVPAN